jgi:homoaconitase/3-isopropylmalate dehydratase large subunit
MGYTFAEKVLARAAGLPEARAGQVIDVYPDVVLSHDNSAAIIRLFREIGVERVKHPERLAIALDHAVPAPTTQHAQNHAEIRRFVAEQGIAHFFEVGRGICHQVLCEEGLVLPGGVVLGGDSHSTHYGALGAFGAGIGRSEVAAIWATGTVWLRVPESIKITVTGRLGEWVTSKDLALHIIGQLGADGGDYASVEFHGPGIAALSMESRFVLPNMMAEMGVKNAWVTPDSVTLEWLEGRIPNDKYQISNPKYQISNRQFSKPAIRQLLTSNFQHPISNLQSPISNLQSPTSNLQLPTSNLQSLISNLVLPDPDARYAAEYTYDASAVEPQVACPHAVDNVVPLSQVAGISIQQAFLGTCTNARLEDIAVAAGVVAGRQVAPGTRMLVIPASSQVLREAMRLGYLETLLAAGAVLGVPGCGPCMGNHLGVPAPGEVTISTANRNFRGRMGTRDAEIYLASPAVVAASAVLGRIADPRELEA